MKRERVAITGGALELGQLLELMPDASVAVAADGRILDANVALLGLLGYEAGELIGQGVEVLVPEALRDRHAADREKFAGHPERRTMAEDRRLVARHRDGREIDVLISLLPVATSEGSIVLASLRDITPLRRVEAALRSSEERYRLLFVNSPAGIFRVTVDGRILESNPALARIFGYGSPGELVGRVCFDLWVDPLDRDHVIGRLRRNGGSVTREIHGRRKDGSPNWVLVAASLVDTAEGEVLEWTVLDVSEERRTQAALAETEKQFRTLVESVQAVFWRSNLGSCRFTYLSPKAEVLFGFPCSRWLEDPEFFPGRIHPDDREAVLRFCRDESVAGKEHIVEFRVEKANGEWLWIRNFAHVVVEEGRPVGQFGFFLDVTERRQLEAQFQQAQKMEAVGRLAGGVAHDFNNLMGVVLGYTEGLLAHRGADDPERDQIEQIEQASQCAVALTRQLLAFSRRQVLHARALDMNALVRDVEKILTRLLGEDIQVETGLADDLWAVEADPTQLEQILFNLAVNARDALPTGGCLRITTANVELDAPFVAGHPGSRAGAYACLGVADDGAGMDARTLAHLFEPFFTTKEVGRGTGLGLATVYGIVKQSGGFIEAESALGAGSTFRIYLPRCVDAPCEQRVASVTATQVGGSETVLLVEDSAELREVIRRQLIQAGYVVLAAGSPAEALALSAEHAGAVDLLLTDVVLPGMTGIELARRLGALRAGLRIVLMSGYAEDVANDSGPDLQLFLQKPFSNATLLQTLREALSPPPTTDG